MYQWRNQFGRETKWESGDASCRCSILPLRRTKQSLSRFMDADGLFREDDEQSNRLTDAQVMQQQIREFNRLVAEGQNERQYKRSATSCICGDMGPSPDLLKDLKPSQINCAGRGALSVIRSVNVDESETLRRGLETVQQLLEKQCGNYNPTSDGIADKEFMKSNSSESKMETNSGVRNMQKIDMLERKEDRRKSQAAKPRIFDGSTPVEAFLQQFWACAQYYKWMEEESSAQMKPILSGDAATLVWSQTNPELLTVEICKNCCENGAAQLRRKKNFKLNCVHVGGRQMAICQL